MRDSIFTRHLEQIPAVRLVLCALYGVCLVLFAAYRFPLPLADAVFRDSVRGVLATRAWPLGLGAAGLSCLVVILYACLSRQCIRDGLGRLISQLRATRALWVYGLILYALCHLIIDPPEPRILAKLGEFLTAWAETFVLIAGGLGFLVGFIYGLLPDHHTVDGLRKLLRWLGAMCLLAALAATWLGLANIL